jgi:tetratricopeptide (TPR) repeat protein
MRALLAGLTALAIAGCATAPPRPTELASAEAADALVRQGCYSCLVEARFTYERLASGKARALVLPRLFEATVLVALRERELAIDNGPALARARAIAAELPARDEATRALEIVESTPGHEAGWSSRRLAAFRREHRMAAEDVAASVTALETGTFSPLFRQYLALSRQCSIAPTRRRFEAVEPLSGSFRLPDVAPDAVPLLRYRQATCAGAYARPLETLRSEVPRFVEVGLYLGRLALKDAGRDGGRRARALLDGAYEHLPTSSAVTFLRGSASQAAGDRAKALRYFDETLALENDHEDALLGRTVCLSHLGRHREAIAAATRLLELETADAADARYWRAWNHHKLGELPEARTDVDEARKHRHSVGVLTLAGIIEHDQDDLAPAEKDLALAVDLDARNCIAMWYQALVQLKGKAWGSSAARFTAATGCYDLDAKEDEARRDAMRAADNVDEEFRTQQLAGFEAALRDDLSQASASAFNAAANYLRVREVEKAAACADRAAEDPERAEKVAELRKLIAERK